MSKKQPPPVPVIGAVADSSREEQLLAWEAQQLQRRQPDQAPEPAVVPVAVVPAPASSTEVSAPEAPKAVTAVAGASGYLVMPEFVEPASSDPADRLEHYSRGIFAAQYAARANHERAEQQKLIALGLRLHAIKEEELHKTAGFDTFGALTEDRFSIKKHQANNIIRVLGVAQALEDITTQELKERPLRILVPVLEAHGAKAVRETWQEAARHGNVTDTALRDAANFLGYSPPKEQTVLEVEPPKAKPPASTPVPVADESSRVLEQLRALAEQDLAAARREAEALQSAVQELVEELAGNLER